ncbi:hypothetical protein Hte_007060 [Hypoxylon texense]
MSDRIEELDDQIDQLKDDIETWKKEEEILRSSLDPDKPDFAKKVTELNAVLVERERCEEDLTKLRAEVEELEEQLKKENEELEEANKT